MKSPSPTLQTLGSSQYLVLAKSNEGTKVARISPISQGTWQILSLRHLVSLARSWFGFPSQALSRLHLFTFPTKCLATLSSLQGQNRIQLSVSFVTKESLQETNGIPNIRWRDISKISPAPQMLDGIACRLGTLLVSLAIILAFLSWGLPSSRFGPSAYIKSISHSYFSCQRRMRVRTQAQANYHVTFPVGKNLFINEQESYL